MKNKKNLTSVILNCYNGEKFLNEAVLSVKKQTLKNWELILWDNKSTDGSKKILKSFISKKIKYYCSKKHTSLYEARNMALTKCNGEFIAFIDADDTWESDKLEKQIKLFKNKKIGLVYGNLWIYNQRLDKKKIFSKQKLFRGKVFKKLLSNYNIGIISTVLRKSILELQNLKFDKRYNHIGDFDLFVKLSKICEFDFVQKPVATYRIHGTNLSLKNPNKELSELKIWLKKNNKKLDNEQKKQVIKKIHNKEFIRLKLNGNFIKTLNYFMRTKDLWEDFKNYFLLIFPKKILKKYMWYN